KGTGGFVKTRESTSGSNLNFIGNYFDPVSAKQSDYADDGSENFLYPTISFTGNVQSPNATAVSYWPVLPNTKPVINNISITLNEDLSNSGQLVGSDADSDILTFSKVASPSNGTATVNSAGAYTYTPNANFNGKDSFTLKVNDGSIDSAVATFSITVNAVNDAPTGSVTISGTATQGQTLTAANTLADADGLGAISYQWKADGVSISGATSSTLTLTQAQVGKAITVVANYTDLGSTAESVTSTATSSVANVNDAPVATVATATTNEDIAKTGTLAGTDSDGNTLSYAKVSDPSHGTLTINSSTGAYSYTPTANYNGSDSFSFKVNDGTVDSAASTVTLTINPVNDAPVALVSSIKTLGFTGGESARGETITIGKASVVLPVYNPSTSTSGGYWINLLAVKAQEALQSSYPEYVFQVKDNTVLIVAPTNGGAIPNLTFSNANNTRIDLTVNAPSGVVNGVNYGTNPWASYIDASLAPKLMTLGFTGGEYSRGETIKVGDVSVVLPNYNAATSTSSAFWNEKIAIAVKTALLANSQYSNYVVVHKDNTVLLIAPPSAGSLTTPILDDAQNTKIDLTVNAPSGIVNGVDFGNNPWSAYLQPSVATFNTNKDTAFIGKLTASDVDSSVVTFATVDAPQHGSLVIDSATGKFTYNPNASYAGSDRFTFRANDGSLDSSLQTVAIKVGEINKAPTGGVTINGRATQGQVLTAANTLADADGLGAISYQWKADGVNISGAVNSSLTLAQAQVGKVITVAASYTDVGGTVESITSSATSAVQILSTGSALTGQIYQWKSHTLLSGAEVSLAWLVAPALSNNVKPLYELKSVELNSAAGTVQVGLWMNIDAGIKNFDVNLKNVEGQAISFTSDPTVFPTGWAVQANPDSTGGLSVAGFGDVTMTSTSVQLGTITFKVTNASQNLQINFLEGSVGGVTQVKQQVLTPYTANLQQELSVTGVDGKYTINSLDAGTYSLDASKSLTSLETGSAISSADALAALPSPLTN
ncbi:MAG: tandem-95 repeat protein, partial [Burkholderiales bacterium]|nr:tandem-95 repeat protein [Burkholderiales bacterium]